MEKTFTGIKGKAADIIESVMQAPEIPDDEELQFKIRLCVEEMTENVTSYAYGDGDGPLTISTTRENGRFVVMFCDKGIPFNPLAKEDPDILASADDRQIGGLGIFLCKQMMDDISYTFEQNCNKLRMEITLESNN